MLTGKITFNDVGVSISLPEKWTATMMGKNTYTMSSKKEIGVLCLFFQHFAMVKKGVFVNPLNGKEEEVEYSEEGMFKTFTLQGGGVRNWCKVWETETQVYHIRFMYLCPEHYKDTEMETVKKIVNSLTPVN